MSKYNERGLKVTDLWHLDKRVVSSQEKLSSRGGLEIGRVDIHPFHTNKRMRPIRTTLYWDDSSQTVAEWHNDEELQAMWTELGVVATGPLSQQDGFHFDIDTTKRDPAAKGLGLIKIELDYVDMDDWIHVFNAPQGSTSSDQFKIDPDKDFEICVVYDSNRAFGTALIRLSVPIPLADYRRTSFFIGSSQYRIDFVSSGETTEAMLTKTQGGTFEHVFIRYVNY